MKKLEYLAKDSDQRIYEQFYTAMSDMLPVIAITLKLVELEGKHLLIPGYLLMGIVKNLKDNIDQYNEFRIFRVSLEDVFVLPKPIMFQPSLKRFTKNGK